MSRRRPKPGTRHRAGPVPGDDVVPEGTVIVTVAKRRQKVDGPRPHRSDVEDAQALSSRALVCVSARQDAGDERCPWRSVIANEPPAGRRGRRGHRRSRRRVGGRPRRDRADVTCLRFGSAKSELLARGSIAVRRRNRAGLSRSARTRNVVAIRTRRPERRGRHHRDALHRARPTTPTATTAIGAIEMTRSGT